MRTPGEPPSVPVTLTARGKRQQNQTSSTMTLKIRVIPCLDVKDGRVVKGVNFVDLVDAGDPVAAAAAYDAAGADEICFLDITASHESRDTIFHIVEATAERCFMPLTVGGGVRRGGRPASCWAGADKVSINTAAVRIGSSCARPRRSSGAQCIVVAVDAKRVSRRASPRALGDLHARRAQCDGLDAVACAQRSSPSAPASPAHVHGS